MHQSSSYEVAGSHQSYSGSCIHAVHLDQLTGSIPSLMVPPLREALLKFHALMSGTIEDLRHFRQQKLRAIEKFKRQGGSYTTIHIVDAILHNSVVVLNKLCCLTSRINKTIICLQMILQYSWICSQTTVHWNHLRQCCPMFCHTITWKNFYNG